MEEDDDFGDLYEDALEENLSFPPNPAPVRSQVTYEQEFDDDEELLYGKASPSSSQQQAARAPSLSQQAARAPSLSQQAPRAPSLSQQASVAEGFDLSVNEAQQDTEPGGVIEQDGAKEESETKLNYSENDEVGAHAQASVQGDFVEKTEISMGGREDELNKENAENPVSGSVAFETDQEEKNDRDLAFTPTELPDSENVFQFEVENGLPQQDDIPGIGVVMNGVTTSIPGLSRDYGEIEEDGEGNGENWVAEGSSARQDLTPPTDLAVAESQGLQEDNGWDSDSEDDLQIVLNDDRAVYPNVERREWDFEEGSEDEDGDDLVIVAGGDNPIEEQEWGAETTLSFEGAVPAPTDKALPTDKTGDDKGQTGKGNIGIGNAVVPRAGYGSQHYHSHYSQYKYVRPGAASIPGGISGASGGAANHSRNAIPSGGVWAPGKGGVPTTGRGDWSSSGGRGFVQRSFLSGAGMPPWSNVPGGRGFQNGFEFSLPPNKTVFEIDIDSFEEKPWKLPGTDITDFFNFKLDEDSWKEYCRKLEQHKLEATMQSKIRVYESGRSEQEYDPDLPIELATATGRNEAFGESTQHKLSDPGSAASVGRGRGLGRGRATLPTGRAIQVESGVGERRPSVDFRRQRNHDADAVIEIVLQDASEDDTTGPLKAPESANDIIEREESERGEIEMGYQKQVNTESSLQARHMESWERDDVSKKIISGGAMIPRTLHHGDGILPLPPGPPIHCQPGSSAGPMFPARILDQQHVNRRPQLVKPHKGFPQIGNEYSNGSIANQDARGGRAESYRKEVIGDGVERTEILEIGCTMVDTEREPTPDVRCTNVEQHPMNELQINSRSDGQSKPNSEVKLDEDTIDDHGSDHSVKRQKLSSQNESPATAAGYSHHFKVSKSGNSKAESGNSRGYSKDRGNSRDCSRGRGNGDEEISQYRPSKRMAKEGNKLQSEEEPYLYQKEYLWNSRHSNERDSRHQRSRENPNHHRDDQYLYHGDREEIYRRRVKEERTDKHRERGEYVKAWQGKNEDMRSLREKDEDSRRRDILTKEDGLQHRDRGHDTERDDRQDLLNVRKKKDEDDWRPRLDKEDSKRGDREDNNPVRLEKMDDPYFRRKRDEDLLWKERADKVEITRDMREREDMGGEKHEKADDYRRRRKEEDLQRREKLDKDQSIRDLRDKEDMAREKHEREYGYLRRKDEDLSRRERSDKDQGIRDLRDREDMHREKHERDDESLRRKEEDLRRRERADKDEGLRDLREREDMSREKQERDDDHHLRRREEESRRRTLFDDSRARKQRDDSWRRREREDEHWRKPGFEEVHVRRDREEDKSMLGGRSRHHSEEKMWHGSDRERGRSREEASLSNIDKDRLKEKRRHEEQRGKVKERVDDTSRSRHHERDDMYSRMDRVIYDDRSSRLDRSHLRYDHSGSAHSGEDQKLHWEKRSYDHRNGSASGLVDDRVRHDHALTSRRRKTEDYHTMHHEKKPLERSTEDQESGSVWGVNADRRTHNRTTPPGLSKRMHEQEMTDRYPSKLKRVAADDSASEDEHVKRGRSKLERWASQKERDDASKWDNDTSKHQKTPVNHEESAAGKEEQGTESKRKPGKERPHSREQDDHTANQDGKEAVSNEHVHVADGTRSDADQGGSRQHFETVAKLEKRRERFKQPIPNEKETQKKAENEALLENETDEVKQERPARKRRWGGSSS